ncbi:hypothetical protein GIR35_12350 [Enterococcus faecalis]|nr:hypothetical protein GIR35_12350 [Enterococcus faecalis]
MKENKEFVAGKKATVNVFGRELSKKKAIAVGMGVMCFLALVGGLTVGLHKRGEDAVKQERTVTETEDEARYVIQAGVVAEGWVKGESSPVITHIVNEAEGVDYYHAYDANEQTALDVPADGEYDVSFIAPVNKDGSTYEVPETSKLEAGDAADEESGKPGLPFEFKPVAADKASADTLNGIAGDVAEAVKKGDETLTGEKGSAVIELVKRNIKANPNADEEKSKKAEEGGKDSTGDKAATKPAESNSAGSNGGSGDGGSSKSQHTHNWVAQTTTVHHDAQYQTVHHDAVVEVRSICNYCGADITGHTDEHLLSGDCGSYTTKPVEMSPARDEQVLVSAAWDETVTTGYKCATCGATK